MLLQKQQQLFEQLMTSKENKSKSISFENNDAWRDSLRNKPLKDQIKGINIEIEEMGAKKTPLHLQLKNAFKILPDQSKFQSVTAKTSHRSITRDVVSKDGKKIFNLVTQP